MHARRETISRPSAKHSIFAASTSVPSCRVAQRFGNQALQHLQRARLLQAKLTVSDPDDAYEREADRAADQVMRMAEPAREGGAASSALPRLKRLSAECEEKLQRQMPA